MTQQMLLPGIEVGGTKDDIGIKKFAEVEIKTVRLVDPISRSSGDASHTSAPNDVKDDDIVELEFENGERSWKQWMTVDQLREISESQMSRGDSPTGQVFVPHTWTAKDPSRGWGTIALKTLKIFGIKSADDVIEKSAQAMGAAIADRFESQIERQDKGHSFGLYRFNNPLKIEASDVIRDAKKLAGTDPYLIFLHGTASSSVGSFAKLAGTAEWAKLQERYGDRILALEHRTFSVSPIQNALDLSKLIPDGAHLHFVSHSRGGLVGELMCLAQSRGSKDKFKSLTQAFVVQGDDEILTQRQKQCADLEKLWDNLLEKNLVVERFVRVACPAHGTTLASKRMDYLASGLLNAVGLIPGIKGNPAIEIGYDWLKSLLLTLVKQRADPRHLPGLEAMIPDSPLIEFLNHPDLTTQADLGVIAGDIDVGNLKLTIPALIGNAFFWAKNDLVVNTKAMYDGIRRKEKSYFFFDQGSSVCHFSYFLNQETRTRLNGWLLRANDVPDEFFRELKREDSRARDGQTVNAWLEQEEPMEVEGPAYTLEVSVLHGDLRSSRYPVAVGHYDGDGIVSAEKYLDRLLDGRLTDRLMMRLYPGPVGTAEVIYGASGSSHGGALVIGLGDMGGINSEVVEQGVTTAALRHALASVEQSTLEREPRFRSAAFSSLLIGTYGGNALSVKESIAAVVQGAINANRILYLQNMWDRVRIDKIELVELYEDVAIQAMRAVHELSHDQSSNFAQQVSVKAEPGTIRSLRGGRYQRPASQFETYWYGRIQITGAKDESVIDAARNLTSLQGFFGLDPDRQIMQRHFVDKLIEESAKSPKKRAQLSDIVTGLIIADRDKTGGYVGLEFQVLTDRARIEASLQGTQRRVIDLLVEKSTNKTRYEKELSVSLYELLIPNALKDRTENVILVLDRESAQYPWELMTDRTRPDEPLATRMGLLRQFKTTDFRANPRPSRGNYAIVIGDPINTGLVPLPGAQDEAQQVAALLRGAGYLVQDPIKQDSHRIINDLFANEYQILHVAAHGTYNASAPDQSGVVLGDGIFLTAKELVNLRTVPDLVFINCCHLGKVDRDENSHLQTEHPHRLAASVSEELIKMGVKVVVAAGWAVDDAAAKEFAQWFYKKMLSGEAFGKAVLDARKETHNRYPGTNTWGAYQCYGNPNFRLNQRGETGSTEYRYYSRREYLNELKGIAERPDVQNERGNKWFRDRLAALAEELKDEFSDPTWLSDGEMLAGFGAAWMSLGNYPKAIDYYEKAIRTKDANVPLVAVERLANLQCRYALQLWEAVRAKNGIGNGRGTVDSARRNELEKLITDAKERFEWLLRLEATSERYSMMGKVHKCLALISAKKQERDANLKQAKKFYQKGYKDAEQKKQSPKDWVFPVINFVACALPLPKPNIKELTKLINEGQRLLESAGPNADFRTRILKPDLDLLLRLVAGDLPKHQQTIVSAYKHAFDTRVTPNEAYAVFSRMDFLIDLLTAMGRTGKRATLATTLREIRNELSTFEFDRR